MECLRLKTHASHYQEITLYHKIFDEDKIKSFIKRANKLANTKITYNTKVYRKLKTKIDNEQRKKLKALHLISRDENNKIIETIKIIAEVYENCKIKNYRVIRNLLNNLDYNLERIKFDPKLTRQEQAKLLSKYFKYDFILIRDKSTTDESSKRIQSQSMINTKIKINITELLEEKDDDDNKDDSKEDKKEDEKDEKDNNEEEENSKPKSMTETSNIIDDEEEYEMEAKNIQDKIRLLQKRFAKKGGLMAMNNNNYTKNDIINEPKGTPDEIITLISEQKINKDTKKKKPKKIKFSG
jgi:hypothetical protein